jgi:hypothetical protein
MAEPDPEDPLPLSAILRDLCAGAERDSTVAELVESFGSRAFGAILFIFAVACALPLPPGASTVFGAPLVLLAPQVALGARAPWLPEAVRRRRIAAGDLRRVSERVFPWLERIEKVSRPRLSLLFGPVGDRVIGVVCTVLALVLILPIPLGNVLPAAAVALLALALVTRDGLLALAGYATTLASTAVLVFAFGVVFKTVRHLMSLIATA